MLTRSGQLKQPVNQQLFDPNWPSSEQRASFPAGISRHQQMVLASPDCCPNILSDSSNAVLNFSLSQNGISRPKITIPVRNHPIVDGVQNFLGSSPKISLRCCNRMLSQLEFEFAGISRPNACTTRAGCTQINMCIRYTAAAGASDEMQAARVDSRSASAGGLAGKSRKSLGSREGRWL